MKLNRSFVVALALFLFGCFAVVTMAAVRSEDSDPKQLVGLWEGTAIAAGDGQTLQAAIELKLDGKKLIGEVRSDQGVMTVSDVAFTDGQWVLDCTSSEGATARLTFSVKAGKMSGKWTYGDANGTFELNKTEKKKP